jgi:plasmid maintenance system antidote protein VapI
MPPAKGSQPIKVHGSIPVNVGAWLRRAFVEPFNITMEETADRTGIPIDQLRPLLKGKTLLTTQMAAGFDIAFGIRSSTLMAMQERREWIRKGGIITIPKELSDHLGWTTETKLEWVITEGERRLILREVPREGQDDG